MFNLTESEKALVELLIEESEANGHDFGVLEEVQWPDRKALGGLVTSLQQKGVITEIDKQDINGEYIVTQYVLHSYYTDTSDGPDFNEREHGRLLG